MEIEYTKLTGLQGSFDEVASLPNDSTEGIAYYKALMEKKSIFPIKFTKLVRKKNRYELEDRGLNLYLELAECSGYREAYNISGINLDRIFRVSVGSINESTKEVRLLCDSVTRTLRNFYIRQIDAKLDKKEKVVLHANVKKVYESGEGSFLTLDIEGVGIPGRLNIQEWSVHRTRGFAGVVAVGDVIPVELLKKRRVRGSSTVYFECSRKAAVAPIAWENIKERYPVQSIVTLTCVSTRARNFFATIEGLQDIEVLCDYPNHKDKQGNPISIDVGCRYAGVVVRADEKAQHLVCRIYHKLQQKT